MFFDGWYPLLKTLISGVVAYVLLILLLRLCGKRTLSKWNAFDYVVTIALGPTLATILLSKQRTIVQGVTALVILVLLQFVVTWLSVRSHGFSGLVKAKPTLLLWQGEFQSDALRRTRVTVNVERPLSTSFPITLKLPSFDAAGVFVFRQRRDAPFPAGIQTQFSSRIRKNVTGGAVLHSSREAAMIKENMRKKIRLTFATAAFLVLVPNLWLTGCSHESAERSVAEQQEDQKLVEQVKATFATSNSFKFPDVQVAAFRKTVQLSGFVVSDDQKQAAGDLAKNVPGVQAVENKISEKR